MNKLRDVITEALKDVHIEAGRKDEFEKVVNKIEIEVSKNILNQNIDTYTEQDKDFSKYDMFDE